MSRISFKNVSKSYGHEPVIHNLNFSLNEGKIIGLLGPNGSGKSTIIKMINGLIPTTEGSITIDGCNLGIETKKLISYLPERTYLNNSMNATECIKFFKDFYDDFDSDKALGLLNKLNIDPNKKFKYLSKGTKEKIQLVLVVSRRANIYILDEPIAGVDPAARDLVLSLIKENISPDSTLIICTHLIYDIEPILDEAIFLSNGRVVLYDSVENIKSKYDGSVDKAFREVFRCF